MRQLPRRIHSVRVSQRGNDRPPWDWLDWALLVALGVTILGLLRCGGEPFDLGGGDDLGMGAVDAGSAQPLGEPRDGGSPPPATVVATVVAAPQCRPLPPREKWSIQTSPWLMPPENAIDGHLDTRWQSATRTAGNEWLRIDFGAPAFVARLTIVSIFEVGESWEVWGDGSLVDSGHGTDGVEPTVVELGSVVSVLELRQTGAALDSFWNVYELMPEGCP